MGVFVKNDLRSSLCCGKPKCIIAKFKYYLVKTWDSADGHRAPKMQYDPQ